MFKQLTFGEGDLNLYQTPFGAHTLNRYEELKELRTKYAAKETHSEIYGSEELELRREQTVDKHLCSGELW